MLGSSRRLCSAGDVVGKYREIVRNDGVVLLVGPVTGHLPSMRGWGRRGL